MNTKIIAPPAAGRHKDRKGRSFTKNKSILVRLGASGPWWRLPLKIWVCADEFKIDSPSCGGQAQSQKGTKLHKE